MKDDSNLRSLLGKLLEEQDIKKEKLETKIVKEESISAAAKTAFKDNAGTLSASQNKQNAKEDPSAVIRQHLLSAYEVIKKNPQLKLGKITALIKAHFQAEEAKKVAAKPKSNAALVTKNQDGTVAPIGQAVKPAANGPQQAPAAVKTESLEDLL